MQHWIGRPISSGRIPPRRAAARGIARPDATKSTPLISAARPLAQAPEARDTPGRRGAPRGGNGHERDRAAAALRGSDGRAGEERESAGARPERGRGRTRHKQPAAGRQAAPAGRALPWTWVYSDPHFANTRRASPPSAARSGAATYGDAYLLEEWTHDVRDHDTVICLGDVTIDRPTDGLIDRLRRRPDRKILVAGTTTTPTSAASGGRSTKWRRAPTCRASPTCSSRTCPWTTSRPPA